jgi:hypothetical protein
MDRENSLTLLWPEWGSNPMPSDPQSKPLIDCATGLGSQFLYIFHSRIDGEDEMRVGWRKEAGVGGMG